MTDALWSASEAALGMHPIATELHLQCIEDGIPNASLKPCACGGGPGMGYPRALTRVWIGCTECGAQGPSITLSLRPERADLREAGAKAAAAWNALRTPA